MDAAAVCGGHQVMKVGSQATCNVSHALNVCPALTKAPPLLLSPVPWLSTCALGMQWRR